jgi:hypothetical protein
MAGNVMYEKDAVHLSFALLTPGVTPLRLYLLQETIRDK